MSLIYQAKKKKINNNNLTVGIVGLGYVGFELFKAIFKKKIKVLGFDISKNKIENIKKNKNYQKIVSLNPNILSNCNFYIVCVPTPVNINNVPDLKFLKKACLTISSLLKKNDIVVFESTVYPGVTRNFCLPLLSNKMKKNKRNFYIGYSPERYSPGDKIKIENISKIVSGENLITLRKIKSFYSKFIKNIYSVSSIEEAEMAKNFENCQRDHNIALVNQLKILCDKTNMNINNILNACKTKWNFNYFTPGLVGGHCISVDPYYLINYAKKNGFNFTSLELSRNINNNFISYSKNKIILFFKKLQIKKNDKILFIGGTYKKNVDDIRNSGAWKIFNKIKKIYPNSFIYDPLLKMTKLDNLKNYRAIIVLVKHECVLNNKKLMKHLTNNIRVFEI